MSFRQYTILINADKPEDGVVTERDAQRWYKALRELASHPCLGIHKGSESCRHESREYAMKTDTSWLADTSFGQAVARGDLWCYSCKAREALGEPLALSYDI